MRRDGEWNEKIKRKKYIFHFQPFDGSLLNTYIYDLRDINW